MEPQHDKSFKDLTTFKIGGPIKNLYYPETTEDVVALLKTGERFHIVGGGSKILADDGPFKNVICTKYLNNIYFDGSTLHSGLSFDDDVLRVGAGVSAYATAIGCMMHGLSGTEFLIDIPATVGGAVVMNAGFMSQEMSQICSSVEYVTLKGEVKETKDIKWSRRWCDLQGKGIVTKATLNLKTEHTKKIKTRLRNYHKLRFSQPKNVASAGGIFINHHILPLIINTLPYLRYGDAEIVESCPNFIVNHGNATYDDVLYLITMIEHYGKLLDIDLVREVKIKR